MSTAACRPWSEVIRMRATVAALAVLLALALGRPALAATCRDLTFPETVKAANTELTLNGLGLRKATIFNVRVYVAALYLPQRSSDAGQILAANRPWRLELRFVRDVAVGDIRDAWQEGFEKSAPERLAALQPRIDALKTAMTDFKSGQSLVFTNDPATGVAVSVSGAAPRSIPGVDFATALLAVWLGPKPPNGDLKSGLLGGRCE